MASTPLSQRFAYWYNIFKQVPKVFEVEFSDLKGRAYALETLTANQLMVLYHHPIESSDKLKQEMVVFS
jgi:hypothetical protein